jgi:hypothetical protein
MQQRQADLYKQTQSFKREQSERAVQATKEGNKGTPRFAPATSLLLSPQHRTILDPAQQASGYQASRVELKYDPPEELAASAHKAARAKMFSPEEESAQLAKIPPGGGLEVKPYGITIDAADAFSTTSIAR